MARPKTDRDYRVNTKIKTDYGKRLEMLIEQLQLGGVNEFIEQAIDEYEQVNRTHKTNQSYVQNPNRTYKTTKNQPELPLNDTRVRGRKSTLTPTLKIKNKKEKDNVLTELEIRSVVDMFNSEFKDYLNGSFGMIDKHGNKTNNLLNMEKALIMFAVSVKREYPNRDAAKTCLQLVRAVGKFWTPTAISDMVSQSPLRLWTTIFCWEKSLFIKRMSTVLTYDKWERENVST